MILLKNRQAVHYEKSRFRNRIQFLELTTLQQEGVVFFFPKSKSEISTQFFFVLKTLLPLKLKHQFSLT